MEDKNKNHNNTVNPKGNTDKANGKNNVDFASEIDVDMEKKNSNNKK